MAEGILIRKEDGRGIFHIMAISSQKHYWHIHAGGEFTDPDERDKLYDELLTFPEYAEYNKDKPFNEFILSD